MRANVVTPNQSRALAAPRGRRVELGHAQENQGHEDRHRVGLAGLGEEGQRDEEEQARDDRQAQVQASGQVPARPPHGPHRERQGGPGVPGQDLREVGEVGDGAPGHAAGPARREGHAQPLGGQGGVALREHDRPRAGGHRGDGEPDGRGNGVGAGAPGLAGQRQQQGERADQERGKEPVAQEGGGEAQPEERAAQPGTPAPRGRALPPPRRRRQAPRGRCSSRGRG